MTNTLTKNQHKIIETFTIQNEKDCKTGSKQIEAITESGKNIRITFYKEPDKSVKNYLIVADSAYCEVHFSRLFQTKYPNVYFGDVLRADMTEKYFDYTYIDKKGMRKLPIAIKIDRKNNQIVLGTRDKSNKAAQIEGDTGVAL